MTLLRSRIVVPVTAPLIEDGAVAISGDRIREVGAWTDLRRRHSAPGPVVDLGDAILLPGLVNAHCHLDYTDFAGHLAPPRSFTEWIQGVLALKGQWGFSEYAASWIQGAKQLVETGCTTVLDIESVPELLPHVWLSSPLRILSAIEITGVRSGRSDDVILEDALRHLVSWVHPRNAGGLAPHAPYSTRLALLRLVAKAARERGVLLSMHLAESQEEFDMFRHARGPMFEWLRPQRDVADCGRHSPVRHAAEAGLLTSRTILAHVNYLDDGDTALLSASGASVVHCPRSHAYFGHAPFPRATLEASGIPVCIGTDSLLTVRKLGRHRPTLDLFAELREAAVALPEVTPRWLLEAVTVKGARALGREGELGELRPGVLADWIAIPYAGSARKAVQAIVEHRGMVASSMIAGEWIRRPAEASMA